MLGVEVPSNSRDPLNHLRVSIGDHLRPCKSIRRGGRKASGALKGVPQTVPEPELLKHPDLHQAQRILHKEVH
jgi:hypothetical protein